jgi:hypothetical protein
LVEESESSESDSESDSESNAFYFDSTWELV